ncbi:MAG: tetratricopeptide repeat protein [Myxococcota bacterium]
MSSASKVSPSPVPIALVAACVAAFGLVLAGCASGPPPTPTDQGWTALEAGDWRSAKTHFAEALRVDDRDARAWHGQAAAQLSGRDAAAALRSLGSLSKVDSARFAGAARETYAEALELAVSQRIARKQAAPALAAARALASLDPNRRGLGPLLGRALMAAAHHERLRGRTDAALALYKEAAERVPADLDAWVGAVEILLERKRGREAMALLEAARRSHPTAAVIRTLARQAIRYRKR